MVNSYKSWAIIIDLNNSFVKVRIIVLSSWAIDLIYYIPSYLVHMKTTNLLYYPIFGYIVITVVIYVHCISNGVLSRQYEYISVYNLNGSIPCSPRLFFRMPINIELKIIIRFRMQFNNKWKCIVDVYRFVQI